MSEHPTPEEVERSNRQREFAMKLAIVQLPTIARQHIWDPALYPDPFCCRCKAPEPVEETWDHIVRCSGNLRGDVRKIREDAIETAKDITASINESRLKEKPPQSLVSVGEVAHKVVPQFPATDTGFLLGYPDPAVREALKEMGLRQAEADLIITNTSLTALESARTLLWHTRCKAVGDILGTRQQRLDGLQPGALAHQPRPRNPVATPLRQRRSLPSGPPEPAVPWTTINSMLFRTDRLQMTVDPSWCS